MIRTGAGGRLDPAIRPAELDAPPPITGLALRSREDVRLGLRNPPDRVHDLMLGMDMSGYRWTINGATYDEHTPLAIAQGQRVRLRFVNQTMMFHPMHLHGHTFQVVDGHGTGPPQGHHPGAAESDGRGGPGRGQPPRPVAGALPQPLPR